jgi:hypothetical protein
LIKLKKVLKPAQVRRYSSCPDYANLAVLPASILKPAQHPDQPLLGFAFLSPTCKLHHSQSVIPDERSGAERKSGIQEIQKTTGFPRIKSGAGLSSPE